MAGQRSSSAAPTVSISDLSTHVLKTVCVAGKVVDASNPSLVRLEDHERVGVSVSRAADAPLVVQQGMTVLVRGTVNQDLSIAEAHDFPTTDLGEKYDLQLHCDAAKVFSKPSLSAAFF